MMKFTNFVLVPMAVAAAVAASACDSSTSSDNDSDDTGGGTGGTTSSTGGSATGGASTGGSATGGSTTGGSTATGGTGATNPMGTKLQPDASGWMDRASVDWNDINVQGAWYPYGDQYGVAKCTGVGMHPAADCSVITEPDPALMSFPNTDGVMCTTGEVAVILPCADGLTTSGCPEKDYSNMWGAGIGFDLNSDGGSLTAPKHPWDPLTVTTGPIIGFQFDIDAPPLQGLRVEIPMLLTDAEDNMVTPALPAGSTTDDHPDGAPYWGASMTYPNSPVMPGTNRVTWADIHPPRTNYVFDTARMLGIQFHVPAVAAAPKGPYSFCISNVIMLRM